MNTGTYYMTIKSLDFVMQMSMDCRVEICVKTLFCELVCLVLEYEIVVWDPHTADGL